MDADPQFVKDIDAKAASGDEVCKVASRCLQAMRSVICSNHVPPSGTAYFAAVVAALQRHINSKDADGATASALLLVLRKALPAVSEAVVQARFNDLAEALAAVVKSEEEGLVRQSLACMSVAADIAYNAGSRPNRKVLKPIFSLLQDQRTQIRHQAELTVTLIAKRAAGANDQQTLESASQHIVQMVQSARPDKKVATENPAQLALTLLKAVAGMLPLDNLSGICVELLKLPALLGQHPCCTESFEFMAAHLRKCLEAKDAEQSRLAAALAVNIFPGLLSVPMSALNSAYIVAYAHVLAASISSLTRSRAADSGSTPEVQRFKMAAVRRLIALFKERDPSVQKGAREASVLAFACAGEDGDRAFLEELPELCRPLLGYEAKASWPNSMPLVSGLFAGFELLKTRNQEQGRFDSVRVLLQELVAVRDKLRPGEINAYGKEISQCIGGAVAAFGPEQVLSVAPLELLQHPLTDTSFEQNSRSWMLLVLKDHLRYANLAFFSSYFLPLATSVRGRMTEAQVSAPIHAKKYENMLDHIWAVLPGFCTEPLDLASAMLADGGRLAKQLVSVLLNEPLLRGHVWLALTRACNSTRDAQSNLSKSLQESNLKCMRTLSGRVLPEMFNAFVKVYIEAGQQDTATAGHARQLALDAVQSYVKIAEPALVGNSFKTLVARMLKITTAEQGTLPAEEQAAGAPTAELAVSIVPHLAPEFLELVLKVFSPILNNAPTEKDSGATGDLQRSAYRALAAVMQHDAAGKIGDATKILELWSLLRDSRQTCTLRAMKARLLAVQAMLLLMQERLAPRFKEPAIRDGYLDCLKTVMPEIMQHLRDPGNAFRDIVRECLHVAVTTAIHQDLQAEIVGLISAGLAGLSRLSKACAVDAFSRMMYEHSHVLEEDLQDQLISVVLLLLEDTDAQVWRAALKFTKVVVFIAPKEQLEKTLPQIFRLFASPHLATAKMMVRAIIERLCKVLPAETLAETFPQKHQPLLNHVQRALARLRRPKTVKERKEEDGGEEDVDMEPARGKPTKSWETFNKEEEGDDGIEEEVGVNKRARKLRRAVAKAAADGENVDMPSAEAKPAAAASREPPNSAVTAHDAIQSLLDAWEAEGEGKGKKGRDGKKRKHDVTESSTWIHEDQDVPLDFMSADAAHSVLTVRPPQQKRQRANESGAAGAQNRVEALRRSGLCFAEDGRLIVSEEAEMAGDGEGEETKLFNHGTSAKSGTPLSHLAEMRRKRQAAKARARLAKGGGLHLIQGLDQYKPKKNSQGDAKRKGQTVDPYAYVRLNPKVVREKFKDKATASFSRLVKGVKQGVLRGKKAKLRDAKKQKAAENKKVLNARQGKKPGGKHGKAGKKKR